MVATRLLPLAVQSRPSVSRPWSGHWAAKVKVERWFEKDDSGKHICERCPFGEVECKFMGAVSEGWKCWRYDLRWYWTWEVWYVMCTSCRYTYIHVYIYIYYISVHMPKKFPIFHCLPYVGAFYVSVVDVYGEECTGCRLSKESCLCSWLVGVSLSRTEALAVGRRSGCKPSKV